MRKIIFLVTFLSTGLCFAADDDCIDSDQRHQKADLVLTKVSFENKTVTGDVNIPHQLVTFSLKNKGSGKFLPRSTDKGGWRNITMRTNGIRKQARIKIPLNSGATTNVFAIYPPNTLKNCVLADVTIDVTHTAKQTGCNIWGNDRKKIQALEKGKLCRTPKLLGDVRKKLDQPQRLKFYPK